ncbi:MAG: hypothetical protein N3B10_02740 [Armatimonadetes bacterium]|nr:hypothetical protein [Armatimonadota bacterium]MCX7967388.1 hypothetical protein [Armatimonadota bacterium]MDW8142621.1 hypothetical protein [Armatimonadota bacterium]
MQKEELKGLSRQIGWLWLAWSISFSILFLLGVFVITGVIPANEIKARRILVVDDKGKPRIALVMEPGHVVELQRKGETFPVHYIESAVVYVYDPTGKPRIMLRAHSDHSAEVNICDRQGKVRIGFTATDLPGVTFYDAEGRGRLTLSLSGTGDPNIKLYSHDWQPIFEAP